MKGQPGQQETTPPPAIRLAEGGRELPIGFVLEDEEMDGESS
jgi:hypothetical protein